MIYATLRDVAHWALATSMQPWEQNSYVYELPEGGYTIRGFWNDRHAAATIPTQWLFVAHQGRTRQP